MYLSSLTITNPRSGTGLTVHRWRSAFFRPDLTLGGWRDVSIQELTPVALLCSSSSSAPIPWLATSTGRFSMSGPPPINRMWRQSRKCARCSPWTDICGRQGVLLSVLGFGVRSGNSITIGWQPLQLWRHGSLVPVIGTSSEFGACYGDITGVWCPLWWHYWSFVPVMMTSLEFGARCNDVAEFGDVMVSSLNVPTGMCRHRRLVPVMLTTLEFCARHNDVIRVCFRCSVY